MNPITERLYVTDIQSVRERPLDGIDHVVTVCQDSVEDNLPEGVHYDFFCMADGVESGHVPGDSSFEMFEQATDRVVAGLTVGDTVLVHCHAGVSRSVAVATAALAVTEDLSTEEAFQRVRMARPLADPHDLLWLHADRYVEMYGLDQYI
ncbi:dual specificity protein phosphatase [Haloarcula virus HCTV-15]|nr:dual specificity protein phosphatase [Haloarcula virus HCTV-6]UBF22524.1 dual specificity protein phosphatase [Haloarcula virus HCTV-15]